MGDLGRAGFEIPQRALTAQAQVAAADGVSDRRNARA